MSGGLDLLVFALDRLFADALAAGLAGAVGRARGAFLRRTVAVRAVTASSGRLIGGRRDALQDLGERRHAGLDGVHVGALERLAQRRDPVLDLDLVLGRHLVAKVLDRPLGLERECLGLVAG